MNEFKDIDFFQLESSVWIANKLQNVPAYDYTFEPIFKIARPRIKNEVTIAARIGPIQDYSKLYASLLEFDYQLINTPREHELASELEFWYPYLKGLTPTSKIYDTFPTLTEFEKDFKFPVFIKGNRQTAKHNPALSIAKSHEDLIRIGEAYRNDPILHWQKIVIREFVELKPLSISAKDKVQLSFEFRTFWWKNQLVGTGHYWSQYADYTWSDVQKSEALTIAKKAVEMLNIPFLVIDMALTIEDQWIIIECNDAQESGYCGMNPITLWNNIIHIEKHDGSR